VGCLLKMLKDWTFWSFADPDDAGEDTGSAFTQELSASIMTSA
jgi:hypothetical protein